jgi:phage tail sheath gpL-like
VADLIGRPQDDISPTNEQAAVRVVQKQPDLTADAKDTVDVSKDDLAAGLWGLGGGVHSAWLLRISGWTL